jgi:RNA polymerase sigma-70 factor (ECF subfamily)
MSYRECVGTIPSQPADIPREASNTVTPENLVQFYTASNAQTYNLTQVQFDEVFSNPDQANFLTVGKPQYRNDYILAHACAHGLNCAWEHFLALYRQPLTRAAVAIAGNQGVELADSLAAELFGLTTKTGSANPVRKSPLASYKGRGSLLGWLRTTIAQRHVDHHRKTWREQSFDDPNHPVAEPAQSSSEPASAPETTNLAQAVQQALTKQAPEDRFLLVAYYLDQQTLLQIGRLLRVHEATISRKLRRILEDLRKDILANLQSLGLSQRAAQEALGTDPRDLDQLTSKLRKLLQTSQSDAFPEKTDS